MTGHDDRIARSASRETGYRKNQLPAGVTMVQVKRRFTAIRIRPGAVTFRHEHDGPWIPITIERVTKAKRPWVVRLSMDDGTIMYLRPFLPGEAGLTDCGSRVGGIGDSAPLGNDPVSAVISIFAILLYVLAAPFFVVANGKRAKAAKGLRQDLDRALGPAVGARPDTSAR